MGETPSTATKRVEGTRRSVYLTTSRDWPRESRDWPSLRAVLEAARTTRAPSEVMLVVRVVLVYWRERAWRGVASWLV